MANQYLLNKFFYLLVAIFQAACPPKIGKIYQTIYIQLKSTN